MLRNHLSVLTERNEADLMADTHKANKHRISHGSDGTWWRSPDRSGGAASTPLIIIRIQMWAPDDVFCVTAHHLVLLLQVTAVERRSCDSGSAGRCLACSVGSSSTHFTYIMICVRYAVKTSSFSCSKVFCLWSFWGSEDRRWCFSLSSPLRWWNKTDVVLQHLHLQTSDPSQAGGKLCWSDQ